MDYFKILNLSREPFSNSPEPEFFFQPTGHRACLQQLELSIRLRRGLNVVMGEVGTGKTTLCRQLIRRFTESEDDRKEIETHLLLDPSFSTPREFLATVAVSFGIPEVESAESEWQLKEGIKHYLFRKGVDEKKTIVLIIDEGQKLPDFCREILREFLNYETNENKLLQIVIFAQNEFREILKDHKNFADRVNQYYLLGPLSFLGTRAMIRFRLARAGRPADGLRLFTLPALWKIYRATGGYPRRIITLCHQIMLAVIIQNRVRANWILVRSAARRLMPELIRRERRTTAALAGFLFLAVIALLSFLPESLPVIRYDSRLSQATANPTKETPSIKPAAPATSAGPVESSSGQTQGNLTAAAPVVSVKEVTAPLNPAQVLPVKTAPDLKVPDNLGRLKIRAGGTVIQLLRDIYGGTGTDRFQAVIEANHHIEDINRVRTGELIAFPAVPVAATPWPQDGKLVRIADKGSLDEAYSFYKKYPSYKKYPAYIRILPFWNPREGMVFALVLRTVFYSEEEAQKAIRNLQPALAATAEIMKKPQADTVFFAN